MNYLAEFFIKNYKFTIVVSIFVVIFGVTGVLRINSESFPSVNIGAVVINTVYGGATAEDIETKITKPIEEEIQKVSGIKRVKSTSQAGVSSIVTEVDIDKYDVEKVVADLQRAVDRASGLPTDLENKPVFVEIKSDEFPVIEVAIIGENTNRIRDQVADYLKEDITDNKNVSSAFLSGFAERQFNIYLNRQSLQDKHVAINEVQRALEQRNLTIPGGEIKGAKDQKLIRIEGKAKTIEDLKTLVIRSNFSGQRILLEDIALIEDSSVEPNTLARHNNRPATLLTITKKGGADLLVLADQIEQTIEIYREKYKGQLEFEIYNNEGIRVADRLSVLTSNGWQGLVLVLFFLLIFLPGRIGIVTAISLPLALFATLGSVMVIGYSLNTITIIALVIALGMLVDNAVVISENYTRLRDEGLETDDALLKTIRDLWAPITATALTTVAAFLPMLVTTGVMGQFIKAIPIVVSIALMLSLLESFFLLPMRLKLSSYTKKETQKKDWFEDKVGPIFEKQMTWLVTHKWKSAGFYLIVLFSAIFMMAFGNKVNLFPAEQTEIYISRLEAPIGTRLEVTNQITDEVMKSIKEKLSDKAVHLVSTAGESSVDNSDPKSQVGSNTAMIKIFVSKDTTDNVSTKEILDALRTVKNNRLKSISFEALVNGPPVGDPVTVTFRSNDMKELTEVATIIKDKIATQNGIFDAKVDDVIGDDEVFVNVDYEKAARLGLSLQDVGLTIRTAIAGQKIGDVNLNNREVDYFLRFEDKDKANLQDLSNVKIADLQGNLIPLKNIATFDTQPGAPQIKRYDYRRAKTVTANIDDSIITSIQANAIIKADFELIQDKYKTVSIEFGGEAEKTNESVGSLMGALVLSLIGIFALLVLIFKSFLSPFIILTTIPLGLVGVSFAFFIHQKPLSFMALIGVIGLGGIIVNSGIVLISFIEQMKQETKFSLTEILIKSSGLRLRAVLVTSLTTISGLVPTAYGIGGVDYFIIPMALALAWGMTTGTILTLYWIPPAYAIVDDLLLRWKEYRMPSLINKKAKQPVGEKLHAK
jgi:multidrug efflux pump subunit AcrB